MRFPDGICDFYKILTEGYFYINRTNLLLLLLSGPILIYALSFDMTITTVAGDGTVCEPGPDPCGDNGPASVAQLNRPIDLALDAAGNLYIADYLNYRIRKVLATTGSIVTVAGDGTACAPSPEACGDGGPAKSAQLLSPTGIALDEAGNLYIADDTRIRKVLAETGMITTVAGDGTLCGDASPGSCGDGGLATKAKLTGAFAVAVDGMDNLYIANWLHHRIRKVSAATGIITTVVGNGLRCESSTDSCGDKGPATAARLNEPRGVAVDKAGNLYIADSGNRRIRKVSAATGVIITVAGDGTSCNPTTGLCGDGGLALHARMNAPAAVVLDSAGNLYIADPFSNRVRQVSAATGIMTTVAGNGHTGFGGDSGPSTAARLNWPFGVVLDEAGVFFIADSLNHRVRKAGKLTPPEIAVLVETTNISDNTGVVDFGTTISGLPLTKTFTISNTGDLDLILTPPITVPLGFSVANSFGSVAVASHSATTFQVRLDADATGVASGGLIFGTNDPDENPFNFTISGKVAVAIVYLPTVLK